MKSPVRVGECNRSKCRKTDICEDWEPEPQTAAAGTEIKAGALIRDEDKHDTERMDAVEGNVGKKSFFGRLFGGK
jgi:hypothetical protein